MLDSAETLSGGRDFLLIDFYEIDGKPRFGEFCLYPGSGLDRFAADWIDFELGTLWHQAAQDQALKHADLSAIIVQTGAHHAGTRLIGTG